MEKIFHIKKQITAKKISTLKCIENVNELLHGGGNVGDVVLLEQQLVCEYEDAVSYHQELLRYMYKGVRILENLGNVVYTCRSDINSYIWNRGEGVSSILPQDSEWSIKSTGNSDIEQAAKKIIELTDERELHSPDSLVDEAFHEEDDEEGIEPDSLKNEDSIKDAGDSDNRKLLNDDALRTKGEYDSAETGMFRLVPKI